MWGLLKRRQPDFTRFPVEIRPKGRIGALCILIILLLIAFSYSVILGLVLLLPAAWFIKSILNSPGHTICRDKVICHKAGKKDAILWEEPLANYDGVLLDANRGNGAFISYWLYLQHPTNPSLTVDLHVQYGRESMHALWEAAARALNLPAVRSLDWGGEERRDAGTLDSSIKERAESGGIRVAFDQGAPLPSGVGWRSGEGFLEAWSKLHIVFRIIFSVVSAPIALVLGMIVVLIVVDDPSDGLSTGFILVLWAALLVVINTYHNYVRLTPRHVTVVRRLFLGLTFSRGVLPLSSIRNIETNSERISFSVSLISDEGRLQLRWLIKSQADWMSDFIKAAIASAPSDGT